MKRLLVAILSLLFFNTVLAQQGVTHPLPAGVIFTSPYVTYGERGLYYVNPDTLEMEMLLEGDFDRALWSPDGAKIATVDSTQHICIYWFSEQEQHCIDSSFRLWDDGDMYDFPIAWGGDSEHILLLRYGLNLTPQLGTINIMQNETVFTHFILLNPEEVLTLIYWSPDGQYLAYQTFPSDRPWYPSAEPGKLYVMDVQTGETQLITDRSQSGCIAWSPEGERIGVVQEKWPYSEQDQRFIYGGISVFDVNGNVLNEIQPQYEGQEISGCHFAWANDGTRLAFWGQDELPYGGIEFALFVTEFNDGETYKVLTPSYSSYFLEWSPGDTHIVAEGTSSYFDDVRVISLDGWERRYVAPEFSGGSLARPDWRPSEN